VAEFEHGCLVIPVPLVHDLLDGLPKGISPSHRQIFTAAKSGDACRLETWAAELLLTCKAGQPFGPDKEALVSSMLERRSGPIAAAITIAIALP
jgi:hypothetical protein